MNTSPPYAFLRDNIFLSEAQLSSARKILIRKETSSWHLDFSVSMTHLSQDGNYCYGHTVTECYKKGPADPHSPFHFSNRETGLERYSDLRHGLRSRISESPLAHFPVFTTHAELFGRGKDVFLNEHLLLQLASLRVPNSLYYSWCCMVYRHVLGPSLSHLSLTEVARGKVLYIYLWMNTFRLWALSNLARNHMSSN